MNGYRKHAIWISLIPFLANRMVSRKNWWIAAPEHINYFDFHSLEKLLQLLGYEVLAKTADFPMELFLLMGENYVDSPKIGKECHHKRIEFERNISKELRRELYESLAQLGLGRECTIYARPKI